MSDYFNEAFDLLLKNEGGYVNDPDDAGGETKWGISKRAYPHLDIKNMSQEQAKRIYFTDYWLKYKCDQVKDKIFSQKFFDICVNMGGKQATICLQRALRACSIDIKDDGIIGPVTIKAVNDYPLSFSLRSCMRSESAGYYRLLAAKDSKNEKYLQGWLNRAYA